MPTSYPVPLHRSVEELLGGLVPSDVRVKSAGIDDPERDTPGVFAEYVTDDDELVVCCFAGLSLVNSVGGALLDVEPNVTQESTSKSMVHDGCLDGFREVVPPQRHGELHRCKHQGEDDGGPPLVETDPERSERTGPPHDGVDDGCGHTQQQQTHDRETDEEAGHRLGREADECHADGRDQSEVQDADRQ